VRAHDQGAGTQHVVAVGERDERNGGEVVDQHDVEILKTGGGLNTPRTNRIKRVQRVTVVLLVTQVLLALLVIYCLGSYNNNNNNQKHFFKQEEFWGKGPHGEPGSTGICVIVYLVFLLLRTQKRPVIIKPFFPFALQASFTLDSGDKRRLTRSATQGEVFQENPVVCRVPHRRPQNHDDDTA